MPTDPQILFCNCTYAQVVSKEVKEAVLRSLCESGMAFEAVADLCELSARKDPLLQRLSQSGSLKIAACYPRAVKWLFASANAPLPSAETEVLNMRVQSAQDVCSALARPGLEPNLPAGKTTTPPPNELPETTSPPTLDQVPVPVREDPDSTVIVQ
jgi:hypothetical protein